MGPGGPGEGRRGGRRREGPAPAAATAAAVVRPGRAPPSARTARGPRSPAQPCECPHRFRGCKPGGGQARRFWCLPCWRRPVGPGSAALSRLSPSIRPRPRRVFPAFPGRRELLPQKPPPPGLQRLALPPSSHGRALAAGAPGRWGGPGRRAGSRLRPGPWHARSPGAFAAFAAGEAGLEMGRGRRRVRAGLRAELILLALGAGLSGFVAGREVTEPGLEPGSPPKPGVAEAGEDCPGGGIELFPGNGGWCEVPATAGPGHSAELVWARGCSPGLEVGFNPASAPFVLLSRVRPESHLPYRPSPAVLTRVQAGCPSTYCAQPHVTILVPWLPSAGPRPGPAAFGQGTASEEGYDHLADAETGPERLVVFSRSHSWFGRSRD